MSNKLTKMPEWKALADHHKEASSVHIRDLFVRDPARFDHFHLRHEGLLYDYSKHNITAETRTLLLDLAKVCGAESLRGDMFGGKTINNTEDRAVLHTALRRPAKDNVKVDGENVMPLVHAALEKMKQAAQAVRSGEWKGHTGKSITDVVAIGIGGSILGPRMAVKALAPYTDRNLKFHFVSNVDGSDLSETLLNLRRETTLFIVASKTFTTQETMTNALSAKDWLCGRQSHDIAKSHFIAVTAEVKNAADFGIAPENVFPLWDWVGGRYSIWSSVGLPLCIAIGPENFQKFLDGAYSMDRHFQDAPPEENIPVIMALAGIWQRNFCDRPALAILPYEQYLAGLPSYLSQLEMESNGKSVDRDGNKIDYATCPVLFGETGTDAQHSFFQMLHQGTDITPCDFILCAKTQHPMGDHHRKLLANGIAQMQAMMQGKEDTKNPHRNFNGNRPSTAIVLDRLDPYYLGMLLALYEHKVFVQGAIWNLNSFDQWGVELGKVQAKTVLSSLENSGAQGLDSSTQGLIRHVKSR
ncbi:MAG TPA: glucose-6-phosphate isomerase [Rhodospirillaceae bacterium]|nr:glucose-6-phosphate isomerase [Rhodospirillaceae bacterium]